MTKNMFISSKNYWFSRLATLTSLLTLTLVMFENYTRLVTIIPPQTWLENTKLYLTFSIGVLIFFLTCSAWLLRKQLSIRPFLVCLVLVLLAVSEVFIDAWAFTLHISINNRLVHLFISLLMLSFLWWLGSITRPHSYSFSTEEGYKKFRLATWLGMLFVCLQIALGAWAAINHAEQVCRDFPLCNGQWMPPFEWNTLWTSQLSNEALITLHMLHRLGMAVTAIYISIFSLLLIFNRQLCEMGFTILFLLCLEVILNGLNIAWIQLPWISLTQDAVALLLLLTLISLLISLYRKPQDFW